MREVLVHTNVHWHGKMFYVPWEKSFVYCFFFFGGNGSVMGKLITNFDGLNGNQDDNKIMLSTCCREFD